MRPRSPVALSILLVSASALAPSALAQTPVFPAQEFSVGKHPRAVAKGDLDHDGRLDLVTANMLSNDVSVLLATGGGHYGPAASFPTHSTPQALVVVDLNNDGNLDVVTADTGSDLVTSLLGTPSGALTLGYTASVGASQPADIAAADINHDGAVDVVTANSTSGNLTFLPGDGNGGFGAIQLAAVGARPTALVLEDFDNDGHVDAAAACYGSNSVVILLGTGMGFSTPSASIPIAPSPFAIASGDLDADGAPDLVVACIKTNQIAVLLGNGAGGFSAPAYDSQGNHPAFVALGDLDADGTLDVVAGSVESKGFNVRYGAGDGSLLYGPQVLAGGQPADAILADLDGDGFLDAATANLMEDTVTVLRGDGAGSFVDPPSAGKGGVLALVDLNLDGHLDLVGYDFVSLGLGAAAFGPPVPLDTVNDIAISLASGDIDNDGKLDVVYAPRDSFCLVAHKGNGAGGFAPLTKFGLGYNGTAVALGDLDSNGTLDVVANYAEDGQCKVFLNNGAGGFLPPVTYLFTWSGLAQSPFSVDLVDANGDGAVDIVTAQWGGFAPADVVAILHGNGSGSFSPPGIYATASGACAVVRDVNRDLVPDLVVCNPLTNTVSVLLGVAGGAFLPVTNYPIGSGGDWAIGSYSLVVGDVTGDGNEDIVVTNGSSLDVVLFSGLGGGAFDAGTAFRYTNFSIGYFGGETRAVLGDLDSDGRMDLAVSDVDKTWIARNQSGTPAGIANYGTGTFGCSGLLAMSANGPPKVNDSAFCLTGTDAPASSRGLCIIADAADLPGTDLFGLGILIHLGLGAATELLAFDINSDAAGAALAPAPIPNFPPLVGKQYFAQSIWLELPGKKCSPGAAGLVTSTGLSIVIQP